MDLFDLPTTLVSRFEMRVMPNTRLLRSAFNPAAGQTLDLLGDYWVCSFVIPSHITPELGPRLEALFDRLNGTERGLRVWNLKRPFPRGTLRDDAGAVSVVNASLAGVSVVNASAAAVSVVGGTPTLRHPIAQFARTGTVLCRPGRTLLAGDHFGLANGQCVRQLVDTVADGNGEMPVEFAPAARSDVAAATAITVTKPSVGFRLKGPVPVVYEGLKFGDVVVDLEEAIDL
ncbi:MAG: hypothetical protein KF788_08885 [Piscinibacter sp.]|nr:hypothetical protein [Piscinibacter sp.]